ncbi:methyltransferase domain-containing protein [Qipengyuania sp. XHP0207]|uniref:class I SAM-dependent methyltransferase n=1 Tax=Qipengyuania sp. XHP0207 TaxID=3038078 RepID=UPI00241E31E9|nr:class I SAM-dependent methyltransferase [Qipengyuania sp. XHP0207]MDG5748293.1 methyltransferase domain-containing protein [Qipengyuania sp. XHP0207]
MRAVDRLYPEIQVGGFSRRDHKISFFSRVNALLKGDEVVVDFGAGRGQWGDVQDSYAFRLQHMRGRVKEVIGLDVDEAVCENPFMDRKFVITPGEPLPLPDASVDLIYSYAVFEHVANPEFTASELDRILKPGGWICAWTPNARGYIAAIARMVPNRLHAKVLRKIGMVGNKPGQREDHDVFPTVYKMNGVAEVGRLFPGFENYSYCFSGPEGYAGKSMALAGAMKLYNWLLPQSFGTHLYVFLRKK